MVLCRVGHGEGETGTVERLAWAMAESGRRFFDRECKGVSLAEIMVILSK